MDRMQLIYAILQIRFDNYRTAAGAKAMDKYSKMAEADLVAELQKWKTKRGIK